MDAQMSLAGWVGTPVDLRDGDDVGSAWASFRIAHTPRYRDRNGEWQDGETVWLTVNCHRALAVNVGASLEKGDPVLVAGRLESRARTDDQTGERNPLQVLVAGSVGHDLARGTSRFTKRSRGGARDDAGADATAEAGPGAADDVAVAPDVRDHQPVAAGVG